MGGRKSLKAIRSDLINESCYYYSAFYKHAVARTRARFITALRDGAVSRPPLLHVYRVRTVPVRLFIHSFSAVEKCKFKQPPYVRYDITTVHTRGYVVTK